MEQFGAGTAARICAHGQRIPPTVIRLGDAAAEAEVRDAGIDLAPGALLSSARLVGSGDVTTTEPFRSGRVAIQDEASQLVALLVGMGRRLLDCCAAPGSKTSALAARNPEAHIVAADLHPHRVRIMQQLVRAPNVEFAATAIEDLPRGEAFDRVLADVPCSGTGTLARNPEIKWKLRPEDLADLQARQVRILQAAMAQVAPGGRLVYSTCSLEKEENQDVVAAALAGSAGFRLLDCAAELEPLRASGDLTWEDPASLCRGGFLRTLPGTHPCDGFFAAILQRD
jgi:16S rRNA (cytosine967-C5)-methyltransferase